MTINLPLKTIDPQFQDAFYKGHFQFTIWLGIVESSSLSKEQITWVVFKKQCKNTIKLNKFMTLLTRIFTTSNEICEIKLMVQSLKAIIPIKNSTKTQRARNFYQPKRNSMELLTDPPHTKYLQSK